MKGYEYYTNSSDYQIKGDIYTSIDGELGVRNIGIKLLIDDEWLDAKPTTESYAKFCQILIYSYELDRSEAVHAEDYVGEYE